MKSYSIPDLLHGKIYYPRSIARKYQYGEITYATKREDIYLSEGYEAFAIRFNGDRWATIAVKVAD
jgi:hypothetical protein